MRNPSAAERWLEFVEPKHRRDVIYDGCLWRWEDTRWVNLTARREAEGRIVDGQRLDFDTVLSDGQREERIYDATPDWDELKRELPGLDVIEQPDGTKTADFRDKSDDLRYKKRLAEMMGERRKLEIEKSHDLSSRVETVVIGKGKHKQSVPLVSAEKLDRVLHGRG